MKRIKTLPLLQNLLIACPFMHLDRIRIFYHILINRDLQQHHFNDTSIQETRETFYHPIDAETLMVIFGRNNYRKIIDWLKSKGLLIVDETYQFNSYSTSLNRTKRYKIPKDLISTDSDGIYHYGQLSDKKSINAFHRLQCKINSNREETLHRLKYGATLARWVNAFDYSALPHTDFSPSVDRFGNRFHSQVTNLSSKGRSKIRLKHNHEQLVEIDIINSQPFFVSQLNSYNIYQLLPYGDAELVSPIIHELSKSSDLVRFKNILSIDDIYTFWGAEIDLSDRKEVKDIFFASIFGRHSKYSPPGQKFGDYFPDLIKAFDAIKWLRLNSNPSQKQWSNLSMILQRFESLMCLEKVIERAIFYGVEPILTIHDSWIVKESQQHLMEIAIKEAFSQFRLDYPKIRTKLLEDNIAPLTMNKNETVRP